MILLKPDPHVCFNCSSGMTEGEMKTLKEGKSPKHFWSHQKWWQHQSLLIWKWIQSRGQQREDTFAAHLQHMQSELLASSWLVLIFSACVQRLCLTCHKTLHKHFTACTSHLLLIISTKYSKHFRKFLKHDLNTFKKKLQINCYCWLSWNIHAY